MYDADPRLDGYQASAPWLGSNQGSVVGLVALSESTEALYVRRWAHRMATRDEYLGVYLSLFSQLSYALSTSLVRSCYIRV